MPIVSLMPIIVRLDDMRGDIDHTVEVTDVEWAALASEAGVHPDATELDASTMADTTLFDSLLDRVEVDHKATHIIWVP
jgi:hypothetical protein